MNIPQIFEELGKVTTVISFIPLILLSIRFFITNNAKMVKRFDLGLILTWLVLTQIHALRYGLLYLQEGFTQFPFPLVVYPLAIAIPVLYHIQKHVEKHLATATVQSNQG